MASRSQGARHIRPKTRCLPILVQDRLCTVACQRENGSGDYASQDHGADRVYPSMQTMSMISPAAGKTPLSTSAVTMLNPCARSWL